LTQIRTNRPTTMRSVYKPKESMRIEYKILKLVEGNLVHIEKGVTDEGESWFGANESHLYISGKECKLFQNWELIATTETPADLLRELELLSLEKQ